MAIGAFIVLDNGPLDGAEIKWPNNGGDFPAIIKFGFYVPVEDGKELEVPRVIKHHKYSAYHGYGVGPAAEDDGLPGQEWQHYLYAGESSEDVPSVKDMWPSA